MLHFIFKVCLYFLYFSNFFYLNGIFLGIWLKQTKNEARNKKVLYDFLSDIRISGLLK